MISFTVGLVVIRVSGCSCPLLARVIRVRLLLPLVAAATAATDYCAPSAPSGPRNTPESVASNRTNNHLLLAPSTDGSYSLKSDLTRLPSAWRFVAGNPPKNPADHPKHTL
jgi:hypothetical protein